MKKLAGNTRVNERVAAMIGARRLPHAILLEGDDGLGKHTLAGFIAAAAVCAGQTRPCGECRGCHLTEVGSHPDIKFVAPEGKQFGVDLVREVRQDAYLRPSMAEKKVYILEKADTMNQSAQNALLKILEEPPSGVIFLLIARSSDDMLDTIRSRCITLSLIPPSHEEAAEYLERTTHYQALEIDKALTAVKDNIGAALSLLETGAKNSYAVVAQGLLQDINGAPAYDMLKRLKPYERDRAAVIAILDEVALRISALIKESCYTHIREGLSREQLVKLYDITVDLRARAQNNAGMMLLFTNLCSSFKSVV